MILSNFFLGLTFCLVLFKADLFAIRCWVIPNRSLLVSLRMSSLFRSDPVVKHTYFDRAPALHRFVCVHLITLSSIHALSSPPQPPSLGRSAQGHPPRLLILRGATIRSTRHPPLPSPRWPLSSINYPHYDHHHHSPTCLSIRAFHFQRRSSSFRLCVRRFFFFFANYDLLPYFFFFLNCLLHVL